MSRGENVDDAFPSARMIAASLVMIDMKRLSLDMRIFDDIDNLATLWLTQGDSAAAGTDGESSTAQADAAEEDETTSLRALAIPKGLPNSCQRLIVNHMPQVKVLRTGFLFQQHLVHVTISDLPLLRQTPASFCAQMDRLETIELIGLPLLTTIGDGLAFKCPNLTDVRILDSPAIETIGSRFCSVCPRLSVLEIYPLLLGIRRVGNWVLSATNLAAVPECMLQYVESIGDYFMFQSAIQEVRFPADSRLQQIGESGFEDCLNLRAVVFPPQLQYIDRCAMSNCPRLRLADFRLCKNLKMIGPRVCHMSSAKSRLMLPRHMGEWLKRSEVVE